MIRQFTLVLLFASFLIAEATAQQAILTAANHQQESINIEIEWLSWEQMAEKMKVEPRKVMVDVYTSWCGWCKRMDATTMKNPVIAKSLQEKYYAVKMDGEYKKNIDFMGRTFKFVPNGRRGYHELPAEIMQGKMSYPTLVFIDENFQIIQPIPGYQSAKDLEPILSFIGDDIYKNTPWLNFQKEFKSSIKK